MGFDYVGVEIDGDYFRKGNERYQRECLGMVKISVFLSLSRQLIFLIPLIYVLPSFMQETGVWLSFPIADG